MSDPKKILEEVVERLEVDITATMRAAKHEPDRESKLEMRAEANGMRIALDRLRTAMTSI